MDFGYFHTTQPDHRDVGGKASTAKKSKATTRLGADSPYPYDIEREKNTYKKSSFHVILDSQY